MSRLRVATYNLYVGGDMTLVFAATGPDHLVRQAVLVRDQVRATSFPERSRAIATIFARERPDLVGLQEVSRWERWTLTPDGTAGERSTWYDFLTVLLESLAEKGVEYDAHAINENFEGGSPVSDTEYLHVTGANVILVRRGSGVGVNRETTGSFASLYEVPTGMDAFRFAIARGWGSVDVEVAGVPMVFANTHLEAYDAAVRRAQRDELLSAVRAPGTPTVVVGDLNARPHELGMPAGWLDAWVAAGDGGDGFTCGQGAALDNAESSLDQRIDYIWIAGASVADCRVFGASVDDRTQPTGLWPSDHAGVIADVALVPRAVSTATALP